GDDTAASTAPIDAGIAPATGVGAEQSASLAVAALGAPAPVDSAATGRAVAGREAYGEVRDPFDPLVDPVAEGQAGGDAGAEGGSDAQTQGTPTVPDVVIPPQIPPPTSVPSMPTAPPTPTVPTVPATPSAPAAPTPAAPAPTPGGTSGWTGRIPGVLPAPGTDAGRLALTASIDMGGEVIEATRGDAVPPDTQRFTVVGITATTVILRLSAGLLPDGTDIVTLELGERVELVDSVTGRPQRITLVGIATG
ncbi:MAG: hypothetical protein RLN63_05665, partial [Miltoncostaeaceae bacterium]